MVTDRCRHRKFSLSGGSPTLRTMTEMLASGPPAMASPATNRPTSPDSRRRPALSPSRAADFKQCPLLYRFRAVDRLPEIPTKAQLRGTLVHSVLERLFTLPQPDRVPARAKELLEPAWSELSVDRPEWTGLFAEDKPEDVDAWLESAAKLIDS